MYSLTIFKRVFGHPQPKRLFFRVKMVGIENPWPDVARLWDSDDDCQFGNFALLDVSPL